MTSPSTSVSQGPRVSVVIPAYNASGCIARAIASVQAQTEQDFEIIVVNDCSTDDTMAVVGALAADDHRIRPVNLEKNGGPSVARNSGFAAAQGRWIAILDADDTYRPERLATLAGRAESENLDVIADNIDLFDYHADATIPRVISIIENDPRDYVPLTLEFFLQNDFVESGYQLGLMKPVVSRAFVQQNRLSYPTGYRHGEDSYFYSALLACGARAEIATAAYYVYTPTFGPISRKISEFSRTNTDYIKKAKSCEDFLQQYGARISSQAARLVSQRRIRMLRFNEFLITLNMRKSAPASTVIARLLRHPSSLQFLLPLAWKRIQRGAAGATK
ncbi:hypothetical protein A5906_15155 [Bradyrhizobium sacchari]|uniref:Succinoglycan biosynthesis protein ExoO n=1 Tax=Bradyrhizobium sacchari TaxID=1399419 RepID=A0A560JAB3_9BRAD|nr:glycosyltransferase family 2 protein [Bradyrhizobium sacchari]OPY94028.1 hypothetical protein A5906_15155 [Bradyrhizobium sacchari]TWB49282.1 succinoglycan biosynthesis protein ExoO [Bradyrhizobium sacchari]TWB68112.1 succinoglycan biosynthesis protein ExoO [Bradyrhizobium sacchari]